MRLVDLFSGCGGMSCGFQNAGFDIVGAFEFWDVAVLCYQKNFDHPVFQADISNYEQILPVIRDLKPDIIIGGPPCQDFSHAGKRIERARADLTISYAHIINNIRPKYFVMENVDRILKSNAYAETRSIFKNAKYGLTELVLDASLCGIPQKRKRFFCIGSLQDTDDFLLESLRADLTKNPTTLRDYFGTALDFEYYYRHPRNYNRRGVFSIDEPAPTMRGVNRPLPPGYPGHSNDACPIRTTNLRALSTLERALIQTFPPDFQWVGTKTDTEQMIGNAVPVKLAEYVANHLMKHINFKSQLEIDPDSFKNWLIIEKQYTMRSAKDAISRINRARCLTQTTDITEYYLFEIEHNKSYQILSTSVRSQIKRALSLYMEYNEQFSQLKPNVSITI